MTMFEMLFDDILYPSDRFSYDRLLRIQWQYKQLGERLHKEGAIA